MLTEKFYLIHRIVQTFLHVAVTPRRFNKWFNFEEIDKSEVPFLSFKNPELFSRDMNPDYNNDYFVE